MYVNKTNIYTRTISLQAKKRIYFHLLYKKMQPDNVGEIIVLFLAFWITAAMISVTNLAETPNAFATPHIPQPKNVKRDEDIPSKKGDLVWDVTCFMGKPP